MHEFFTCIISKSGMAYLTGVGLFLITLFLTSKKIIGFSLTVLFLIFALIASLAVANHDLIRGYFVHPNEQHEATYQNHTQGNFKEEKNDLNADLQKAFDDLKKEFLIEKEKLQKIWEDFNSRTEQKEESPAPEKDKK